MILGIRTDTATAELKLYDAAKGALITGDEYELGRQMAKELLGCIESLLHTHRMDWDSVTALVVFKGPGSFTGLRLGATVANTLAYGLSVPIVGADGEDWFMDGCRRLAQSANDRVVLPVYGGEAHISKPRK